MSPLSDREAFAKLVKAVEPYLDVLVFVGGWAHRLFALHELASPVNFEPLATDDADLAAPLRLQVRKETLAERLIAAGFDEEFRGDDSPPVSEYHLGEEDAGLYVEFLAPLIGAPTTRTGMPRDTTVVGGVTAQTLRYVDLLLEEPWTVKLSERLGFPLGGEGLQIRIPNPASFIAQKLLVLARRQPSKRPKDLLYVHELGNGVVTDYGYSPKSRRLSTLHTVTGSGRDLQAMTYKYDRVGNILELTNALAPAQKRRSGPVHYAFKYDALDRLKQGDGTAESRPGTLDTFHSEFTYSDIHNMTANTQVRQLKNLVTLDPTNGDRPPDSNHAWQYVYRSAGPHQATQVGPTLFSYDANGNTTVECRAGEGHCGPSLIPLPPGNAGDPQNMGHYRRLYWNEENRLAAVVEAGGARATRYLYDAGGDRVVKLGRYGEEISVGQFYTVSGKHHASKHIFAGAERLASKVLALSNGAAAADDGRTGTNLPGCVPSDDQPQKCVDIPGGGPVIAHGHARARPATYYYHPDHLGSTGWMTDQTGRVHEHVEYYPYGEVWRETRGDREDEGAHPRLPSYLYTAKEYDQETGYTYYGARYYDSRRALWVSPDGRPITQGTLGLSRYAYAGLNPLRFNDPDGNALDGPGDYLRILFGGEKAFRESDFDDYRANPELANKRFLAVGGMVVVAVPMVVEAVPVLIGAAAGGGGGGAGAEGMALLLRGVAQKGAELAVANPVATATVATSVAVATTMMMQGRPDGHHIGTNKNKTSTLRGGPWTPRFKALFDKAGVSMNDPANIVDVEGHQGPHPEEYHQTVYERLRGSTKGLRAGTQAYRQAFLEELKALGREIQTVGTELNRLVTRTASSTAGAP